MLVSDLQNQFLVLMEISLFCQFQWMVLNCAIDITLKMPKKSNKFLQIVSYFNAYKWHWNDYAKMQSKYFNRVKSWYLCYFNKITLTFTISTSCCCENENCKQYRAITRFIMRAKTYACKSRQFEWEEIEFSRNGFVSLFFSLMICQKGYHLTRYD